MLEFYLEIGAKDGWCLVHCPDLPGLGYKAPSREAALALAPLRVAAELGWARLRTGPFGLAVPAGEDYEVAGEVTLDVPVATGDTEATFEPELAPLDDSYLAYCLAYLGASRETLQSLVARLPRDLLDWRPAEGKRTIGEILGHVSDAEAFYLVRLEDPAPGRAAEPGAAAGKLWAHYAGRELGPVERLARTRELAVERLGRLTAADRERVSRFDPHAETWTARKVLRRMVWHERYHTRQIETFLVT